MRWKSLTGEPILYLNAIQTSGAGNSCATSVTTALLKSCPTDCPIQRMTRIVTLSGCPVTANQGLNSRTVQIDNVVRVRTILFAPPIHAFTLNFAANSHKIGTNFSILADTLLVACIIVRSSIQIIWKQFTELQLMLSQLEVSIHNDCCCQKC
jgi:hypothetical protein